MDSVLWTLYSKHQSPSSLKKLLVSKLHLPDRLITMVAGSLWLPKTVADFYYSFRKDLPMTLGDRLFQSHDVA